MAAAAVAVGVGQAEAATYDVVLELTDQVYFCVIDECTEPEPDETDFEGIPLFTAIQGVLDISPDSFFTDWIRITFAFDGKVSDLGLFYDEISHYESVDNDPSQSYWISWNGQSGSIGYGDDELPNDPPYGRIVFGDISAVDVAPVPLPASAALLSMGFGALALMRRRRKA